MPLIIKLCDKMMSEAGNVVIMDDININMKDTNVMDEVCHVYGLQNLITVPAHSIHRGHASAATYVIV